MKPVVGLHLPGAAASIAPADAIAATVPSSNATVPAAPSSTSSPTANATAASPTGSDSRANPARDGIWELVTHLRRQRNKIETIQAIDQHTAALAQTFEKISSPPLEQLKVYSARSDALAAQADNADSGGLKSLRSEFDTLAWLFKQTSNILIPLTKEQVLLHQYRHNLGNWRESAQKQYHEALTALAVRLGIVVGILALVFAVGEVWRRAVLRSIV